GAEDPGGGRRGAPRAGHEGARFGRRPGGVRAELRPRPVATRRGHRNPHRVPPAGPPGHRPRPVHRPGHAREGHLREAGGRGDGVAWSAAGPDRTASRLADEWVSNKDAVSERRARLAAKYGARQQTQVLAPGKGESGEPAHVVTTLSDDAKAAIAAEVQGTVE